MNSTGGLKDSRWASSGGTGRLTPSWEGSRVDSTSARDGDWDCSSCRFPNFRWRSSCFRCNTTKMGSTSSEATKENQQPAFQLKSSTATNEDLSRWSGMDGMNEREISYATKDEALVGYEQHQVVKPETSYSTTTNGDVSRGLSKSRWAPRNANGRENGYIWTRTARKSVSRPQHESRPPSPPDLGLPYEVQHYTLSMMQRILEEACWDLASRWVPSELQSKNWTCCEAVELSAWKNFLPSSVPAYAIHQSPSYSLESGLIDAVRIRNAGVHRHLCDNGEIRAMATKALSLMEIFGDTGRRTKFARLRDELRIWDEESRKDRDTARRNLEIALSEIGEREMENMDWTPNSVSLLEIIDDVPPERDDISDGFVDLMDID